MRGALGEWEVENRTWGVYLLISPQRLLDDLRRPPNLFLDPRDQFRFGGVPSQKGGDTLVEVGAHGGQAACWRFFFCGLRKERGNGGWWVGVEVGFAIELRRLGGGGEAVGYRSSGRGLRGRGMHFSEEREDGGE